MSREQIIKSKVEVNHHREFEKSQIGVYAGQTSPAPKVTIQVTRPDEEDSDDDDALSWHSADSSSSVLDSSDVITFRARSNNHTGRFIIYANGVRFVRSFHKQELWRRSFLEIAEMRKLQGSAISQLTLKSSEQLELTFTDGDSVVLDGMKDRDEAFNTIIGFSALQWQVSGIGSCTALCGLGLTKEPSLCNTALEDRVMVKGIGGLSLEARSSTIISTNYSLNLRRMPVILHSIAGAMWIPRIISHLCQRQG